MQAAKIRPPEALSRLSAWTDHLQHVSLFRELVDDPRALGALAAVMSERVYAPGDVILAEGESGEELFVLVSGHASVYKSTAEGERYVVAVLEGSRFPSLGEGALLDADARSATIRADDECHCLVLSRDAFERFSAAHPEWAMPILKRIACTVLHRLMKANADLSLLYRALVTEIRGS